MARRPAERRGVLLDTEPARSLLGEIPKLARGT